jgi:hypothetical protein
MLQDRVLFALLTIEGSFCEVAKSCSSVGAPMTFGPYSTAVTIDDPHTYPTFGTDGALITARSASLTITDSVAPAGSQSVVETTTVTTIWTSAITLEIDHQGSIVSTLSSNDIVSATSTEPSTSSSMPASSNMSAEPVLSFPGANSTTSATPQQSAIPPSNGPSPDLASSAAFANSSTASPAVFANQTSPGLTNTTSAELSASNSSTSMAPTLSKSPHKSSPSPTITSMSPATGLITEPDANDAADGERSTVDTTKTMPRSAMSTAYTTTAGATVDADLVYGVALGAFIVFGVFMLGL